VVLSCAAAGWMDGWKVRGGGVGVWIAQNRGSGAGVGEEGRKD